jgi:hypothetical protein
MEDINVEKIQSSNRDYNFGIEGVHLMYSAESLHQKRLEDLEKRQQELNDKLMALKDHLRKSYKHLKSDNKEPLDLSHVKQNILNLWNEWKEDLKTRDIDEYNNLKTNLEELDFSHLNLEHLDDKLIPELEKIQRHFEFKYQKIPNELRMFIELFTILVEILKEFPKKYSELNSHINRSVTRG